jgi:homoserine kinase
VRVTVRVPATSANLGPGFDSLGLALDLRNEVTLDTEVEPGVTWAGEGAEELPADGSDMVSRAMARVASDAGADLPPFALRGVNRIPIERGLGSSAAACVAGILLADHLVELGLHAADVLATAAAIEGHPDNAAAALHGGLTIAYGQAGVARLDPSPQLRPVLLVPRDRLPTPSARRSLPAEVPHADASFNAAHSALTVVALTSRPDLLSEALDDRLHQRFRLALVPIVLEVFERLRADQTPVCLSGAGPSLLAFDLPGRPVPDPGEGWRVVRAGVATSGAQIVPG